MEHKIIFATANEGKLREIREILKELGMPVLPMKDAGVTVDINESGTTFEENALIKAKAVWAKTGGIVLAVMFGVPLLLILFKEPLTKKIEKRAEGMEESKAMFLVQGFFELFETLLSYFSNTLSYVRIGAFAVSHAAIMEVVLMLSGAENGTPNLFGVILGNVIVCALEGLIVGIQVLRLEYYEMFSRFYKGSGREFKPFNKQSK